MTTFERVNRCLTECGFAPAQDLNVKLDSVLSDSLDRIDFVMSIEEMFGLNDVLEDCESEPIETIGQLVKYLDRKAAK